MKGLKALFLGLKNTIKFKSHLNNNVENSLLFIIGCFLIFFSLISTSLSNVAMIIYILTWAIQQLRGKITYPKIDNFVLVSVLSFVLLATISFIFTSDNFTGLKPYLRLLLIPILIPAFTTEKQKAIAIKTFIASAAINLITIYAKKIGLIPVETFAPGITQGFKDSIFTSLAMALSIFFCINMAGRKQENQASRVTLFILSLAFFHYLYFIAIGRTGQILGLLLISIFCFQKVFTSKKMFVLPLIIATASLLLMNSSFIQRIEISISEAKSYISKPKSELASSDSSLGLRSEWAINALSLASEKPILGFGVGNFKSSYYAFFPEREIKYGEAIDNPHNQFLLTTVEMGVTGLLLYAAFIASILRVCRNNGNKTYSLMLLGTLVCLVIGCVANSWLKDHTSSIIFISLFAALMPINNYKITKKTH